MTAPCQLNSTTNKHSSVFIKYRVGSREAKDPVKGLGAGGRRWGRRARGEEEAPAGEGGGVNRGLGWGLHGDRPHACWARGAFWGREVGNGFGKEAINNQFLISFLLIQNDNYISFHTKMKY